MSKQDLGQLQVRKLKALKRGGEGKSPKGEPSEKKTKQEDMDIDQTSD